MVLGSQGVLVFGMALLLALMLSRIVRFVAKPLHVHAVSAGAFFYALGVLLTALLFPPEATPAFFAGMLVLALADPAASLIGMSIKTRTYRVFGEQRSFGGSLACLLISFVVLIPFVGVPSASVGALFLTAVEAYAPHGSDNLVLPLAAALFVALV
jgi:dolichol kinase